MTFLAEKMADGLLEEPRLKLERQLESLFDAGDEIMGYEYLVGKPCDIRSVLQKRLKHKRTKRFGTSSARSRKCEDIKSAVIGAAKGKAHRQQKRCEPV
jgi:hypothetical protein